MSQDFSKNQRPISHLNENREQRFDERVLQPKHNNQVYSMYNNFMDKSSLVTVSDKGISEFGNLTRSFDISNTLALITFMCKTSPSIKFSSCNSNKNFTSCVCIL